MGIWNKYKSDALPTEQNWRDTIYTIHKLLQRFFITFIHKKSRRGGILWMHYFFLRREAGFALGCAVVVRPDAGRARRDVPD